MAFRRHVPRGEDRRTRDARAAPAAARDPAVASAVLELQARIGNRAVARAIAAGRLVVARNGSDDEMDDEEEHKGPRTKSGRPARSTATYGRQPHSARLREQQGLASSSRAPRLPSTRGVFWDGSREGMRWLRDRKEIADELGPTRVGTGGTTEYRCASCQNWFDFSEIQVDHRRDWWTEVMSSVDPGEHEHEGHVFEGIPFGDALEAYNAIGNLQLMCGPCNSRKSGPKGIEKFEAPKHDPSTCPACNPKGPPRRDDRKGGGGGGFGFGGGDPISV